MMDRRSICIGIGIWHSMLMIITIASFNNVFRREPLPSAVTYSDYRP